MRAIISSFLENNYGKKLSSPVEQGSGIFKATQESNDISPTIIEIGEVLLLNILNHATIQV